MISAARSKSCFQAYEDELGIARGRINRIMFEDPAWQEALVGRLTMRAFWYHIGPSLGLFTHEAIDAFRRRYYSDETVNQEVLALIRLLYRNYRLAVLSNHPPGLEQWLADWGIRNYFEVVFCSGDEGAAKPDPVAYQTTLDRLGIQPAEAIFIDDTAGHVQTARRQGIHGIVFTDAWQLASELGKLLGIAFPLRGHAENDVTRNSSASSADRKT